MSERRWPPHQIKRYACSAAKQQDPTLALFVCRQIEKHDLYINYPTGYGHDPKIVTVKWGDKPCQSKCSHGSVPEGSQAWWLQGIGVWHLECPTPEAVLEILRQHTTPDLFDVETNT